MEKPLNKFDTELTCVYKYLLTTTATTKMVARGTRIYERKIIQYVNKLSRAGVLRFVCIKKCQVTGYNAEYITCNPNYIKEDS